MPLQIKAFPLWRNPENLTRIPMHLLVRLSDSLGMGVNEANAISRKLSSTFGRPVMFFRTSPHLTDLWRCFAVLSKEEYLKWVTTEVPSIYSKEDSSANWDRVFEYYSSLPLDSDELWWTRMTKKTSGFWKKDGQHTVVGTKYVANLDTLDINNDVVKKILEGWFATHGLEVYKVTYNIKSSTQLSFIAKISCSELVWQQFLTQWSTSPSITSIDGKFLRG